MPGEGVRVSGKCLGHCKVVYLSLLLFSGGPPDLGSPPKSRH